MDMNDLMTLDELAGPIVHDADGFVVCKDPNNTFLLAKKYEDKFYMLSRRTSFSPQKFDEWKTEILNFYTFSYERNSDLLRKVGEELKVMELIFGFPH